MMKSINPKLYLILFTLILGVFALNSCKEEEMVFEKTRLFRPVLNRALYAEGNTVFVNLGNMSQAISYTIEVSRDTFNTVEYLYESDTSFVVLNRETLGEELFWNTIYQIRSTARAADSQFDSRPADLGMVRTERFPTILNEPRSFDVTDVAARVSWFQAGAPVTGIKAFSSTDLYLANPLFDERVVTPEEQSAGEAILSGLDPDTEYQIAIYSDETLRGWVNYTTRLPDIDPNDPMVIDVRSIESATAVVDAIPGAPSGAIILVKRGFIYDLPRDGIDKSITIRAAYGFGEKKAMLYTTGNWDIAENAQIDHIRFIDVEIKGANFGGNYIFNPQRNNSSIGELLFENCEIRSLRGMVRIRGNILIDNYVIRNTLVDSIRDYGILTTDTDPNSESPTARVNNIKFINSTFNRIIAGVTTRNNSQSIEIESCTFGNFIEGGSGRQIFRYRGGDGNNNVIQGIKIYNSIFGPGWDVSSSDAFTYRGIEGLPDTNFDLVNNYSTSEFGFSSNEIPGFPIGNYSGKQGDLWVNPGENNFNFKDNNFPGRFSTGALRWRVKI